MSLSIFSKSSARAITRLPVMSMAPGLLRISPLKKYEGRCFMRGNTTTVQLPLLYLQKILHNSSFLRAKTSVNHCLISSLSDDVILSLTITGDIGFSMGWRKKSFPTNWKCKWSGADAPAFAPLKRAVNPSYRAESSKKSSMRGLKTCGSWLFAVTVKWTGQMG